MNGAPRHGGGKSCKEYAMAQDYEIKVKVTGVDQAKTQVDGLSDSLKDAGQQSSQLGVLDKVTGGAVSGFKNAAVRGQDLYYRIKAHTGRNHCHRNRCARGRGYCFSHSIYQHTPGALVSFR